MKTNSEIETTALNPAPNSRVLPAFLLAICLMGLMAVAKGNAFVAKVNHATQYAETLNRKHAAHSPTLVLREPLPLARENAPVPLVIFATRMGHAEARLCADTGAGASIRDRSPPPFLS